MRNPAYSIREASYNALEGVITYEGNAVPVYDTQTDDSAVFPRIILQGITGGGDAFSKCGFGGDWFQSIKISAAFKGRVTQNVVDQISDDVLQVLAPHKGPYLNISPEFNIWKTFAQVLNVQNYTDGAVKYIDLNLQITYSLTES